MEYIVCPCLSCEGHIEFPAHAVAQEIQCPHCGKPTTLHQPASAIHKVDHSNTGDSQPGQPAIPPAQTKATQPLPPLITRKCPFCAELILREAIKCKYCGEMLVIPEQRRRSPLPTHLKLVFAAITAVILFAVYWFFWKMIATASVPPGGGWVENPEAHVNAITLLALIATALVALVLGIAVIVFVRSSKIVKEWLGT